MNQLDRIPLALIITELRVGGAERCLTNLALRLQDPFQPEVYSLAKRPPHPQDELVQQLEQAQVPVHFLDGTRLRFVRTYRRLVDRLGQQKPLIAQCFLFHANVLGAAAARRSGVPAVLLGMRVADPRRSRSLLERYLARRADGVVCVSGAVAQFAAQRGFPPSRLTVIPNAIDCSEYPTAPADRSSMGIRQDRHLVTYVGRLHPQKGLDWLLDCWPVIARQRPQHDLVLVGDGPMRAQLQRQARRLGQASRCHFLGWRKDVTAVMAASQLLVLPSRWEGMPNVVLEAMASGLPVAATQVEGVVELLGPAAEQQTAAFDDSDRFIKLLLEMTSDNSLRGGLGQANRQRACQDFSLDAMVAAYSELYRSLANPLAAK